MNKVKDDDDTNAIIFDAKNFYFVGNYMSCINAILPEQVNGNEELLSYLNLSYLAIDSGRAIKNEIKENNPTGLIVLHYLHQYFEKSEKHDEIVQLFVDKIQDNLENKIWVMAAVIVFLHEGLYENALKTLHNSDNLDCMALTIQCLIKINRLDLAKQILNKMQEKNDDATLTQLSQAWINIAAGSEQQLQDAYHIYQEFCDKYNPTSLLLNGQAICYIGQEKYEEAEDLLKESLLKNHNDYDTLINLTILSYLTGKSLDIINRYIGQIKQYHPNSQFVIDFNKKEDEFELLCLQYAPNNKVAINI